jgi:hypothetical protein
VVVIPVVIAAMALLLVAIMMMGMTAGLLPIV